MESMAVAFFLLKKEYNWRSINVNVLFGNAVSFRAVGMCISYETFAVDFHIRRFSDASK
jgi:hypothetical protein